MGIYVFNKETQKVELHFEKTQYMAFPDEVKKEIQSAFQWSGRAKAWVSRSTKNHYRAFALARKLGFEDGGKQGERLSYAEELERKVERAEERAERYEGYADNAKQRAVTLQADFNKYRKDWSWLTQPIIAGHAGSRAFANHRNKVIARYERGFEEYQKSDYFKHRAATARGTASNAQLENPVYLHNRIKEQNKKIKDLQAAIARNENTLYRVEQGEVLHARYTNEVISIEQMETLIAENLEKYEYEYGKLEFFEKCLEDIGGNRFSKDNIKVGYIVNMRQWGRCEIISAGTVNVGFKILNGGAAGGCLKEPYAAITEVIETKEKKKQEGVNPFAVGDILCKERPADASIYQGYQVVKTTATGVKIQQIAIQDGKPIPNEFVSNSIMQKKVIHSVHSDWVGICVDNWRLYKYTI